LAQTRYGLKSKEDFYEEISNKITTSRTRYKDDLPFTIMSERVLEEEYEPEYGNVYQKGALISMCLDLMLRKDSDGGYGIIDLVNDLSDVYGSEKPFKDDELFDQIEKMTSPEVRAFLDNHVAGPQPLPLEEVLSWVGVDFIPEMQTGDSTVSLGSISIGVNEDRQIIVADNSNMNEFGQEMGYQQGDILLEMNGQEVGIATFRSLVADLQENGKTGEQLTMKIKREEDGVFNEMELSAPIMKIAVVAKNVLKDNPNASEKQVKLRNAWLSAQ
jgi:predicted metalloprotease with PDZ domain